MLTDANRRYLDLLKKCLTASIYEESAWTLIQSDQQAQAGLSTRTNPLRTLWGRALKLASEHALLLVRRTPFDHDRRAEGRDWPLFGYTMVGHKRLENVQACVEDVIANGVPGDLVETGVWRGGTVIFMRALLQAMGVSDRIVWACDSFEGLPRPVSSTDGIDLSHVDLLKVSLDQVQDNFGRFGLLDDQVRFLKGWFSDTLPTAPIQKIAVLRLDGDMYSSTMDALDALYDRVSDGGYVIIDDYFSWESCKQAVGDFLKKRHAEADIQAIDWTGAFWQVRRSSQE